MHVVGKRDGQPHIKTVPVVENSASLSADDAYLSSASAAWHAQHMSVRNADLAETQSMGIHKRHKHHHTTTAPPVQHTAPACYQLNKCDCLPPAVAVTCLQTEQSIADANDSANGAIGLGKRYERTTTSTAQQAEQTYDAASQTPSEAQKLNIVNEEPSHDQSPALPVPQHTPTSGYNPHMKSGSMLTIDR